MGKKNTHNEHDLLKRMLSLNGFENETLADLVTGHFAAPVEDDPLESLMEEALDLETTEQLLDEDAFDRPAGEPDGPILLGYFLEADEAIPVGLYPVDLTRMVLIVGTHGSGKTTLVRNILTQIIENYS